jgi:tRNA nucleotidyltransferase (CCA-adding enzyme)
MPDVDVTALEGDLLLRGVWEGLGTPACHVTGGYVRDRLLGRESTDLDLVLPGTVAQAADPARRLAAQLDSRPHLLGQGSKRVWRIETPRIKIELWTRGDLSMDQDIRRRDFTCNALVWQLPGGPLVDRVKAIDDLQAGVLRAITRKNLEEDPVRLVRAARFLAQFPEMELDPRTANWIRSLAPRTRRAPRERVGQELLTLVTSADCGRGLRAMADLGLLAATAPPDTRCDQNLLRSSLHAASRMLPATHPSPAALAAAATAAPLTLLVRVWGTPSGDALSPYAWPRGTRDHAARAATMLDEAALIADGPVGERKSFMHRAGSSFPTVLATAAAVDANHKWARWWRLWRTRGSKILAPDPLLTGLEISDLLGISPGPALGRAVDALTEAQVRGQVRTTAGAKKWLLRISRPGASIPR